MQLIKSLARIFLICLCLMQIQCDVKVQAPSTDGELAPFFGTYTGSTVVVAKGEISERDLAVTIKPWDKKGFTIDWSTVTYRANGEKKTASPSINFYRSPRPGIYASAMRTDVFGNAVPFDPVGEDADPYVWAGLEDKTLTVRALYIVEAGGYELHVYERTLQEGGLALEFERIRNGELVTEVSAMLKPDNP